jgi:hypothetical protein
MGFAVPDLTTVSGFVDSSLVDFFRRLAGFFFDGI